MTSTRPRTLADPRPGAAGPCRAACRTVLQGVVAGLSWLAAVLGFVAGVADEVITAGLGVPAVLPRWRRWRWRLMSEWRAYRAVDVVEGEVVTDGVWR